MGTSNIFARQFEKLPVRVLLAGSGTLGIVLAAGMAFLAYAMLQQLSTSMNRSLVMETALANHTSADSRMDDIRASILRFYAINTHLSDETAGDVTDDVNSDKDMLTKAVQANAQADLTPEINAQYDRIATLVATFITAADTEIARAKSADGAHNSDYEAFRNGFHALESQMDDTREKLNGEVTAVRTQTAATIARTTEMLEAIAAAGIVLIGFIVWSMTKTLLDLLRRITNAVDKMVQGDLSVEMPATGRRDEIGRLSGAVKTFRDQLSEAERSKTEQTETIVSGIGTGLSALAQGDLLHRISANLTGPFAKLKDDFNTALGRLQETLQSVLLSTTSITTGAGEISQAADDLSRRTEQTAASLEETSAALQEITSNVKRTAQNAKNASNIVSTAKSAAEDGGRIVETAISAMGEIAQSSKQITDIIGVIDEIAFQTNLLALNAGVEAARAGDAGKGFAVVASEVRALAQRSSEAAREIKALIKTSGQQVNAGVKLVGESGEALKRIVDQVVEVNGLVVEMAQAAQHQSTGIEEVNVAINQMDQVTQQNAAMVEESTAAARSLATETEGLSRLVTYFKVEGVEARKVSELPPRRSAPVQTRAPRAVAAGGRSAAAATEHQSDWQEF